MQKLILASDIVKKQPRLAFDRYSSDSIEAFVVSHVSYVAATKRALSANAARPRWFNVHPKQIEPKGNGSI